jgi:hypothetical protein
VGFPEEGLVRWGPRTCNLYVRGVLDHNVVASSFFFFFFSCVRGQFRYMFVRGRVYGFGVVMVDWLQPFPTNEVL